jgi:hypothetical protein
MAKTSKPSLAETHPELAAQADGWDPSAQTSGSNKKMSWQCDEGHAWIASISNRSKGRGCSVCAGKQIVVGYNDLETTHPELAAQADGWDPKTVVAGSNKKLGWKCASGHSWITTVLSRTQGGRKSSGTGCAVCSGRRLLKGFNDLRTVNPDLASEALGWNPSEFLRGSHERKTWICQIGHEWRQTINERSSSGSGCPVCAGKVVQAGFNDLASLYPEIASEALGWDAQTVSSKSNKRLKWKCQVGHEWITAVANRTGGRTGCPVCSGQRVEAGFNDLLTTHPEIASQAIGWNPATVVAGTKAKYKWECKVGHRWFASVHNRALNGRGCPICANKEVLVGFNDLLTLDPVLAAEADGWDPTTVTAGSQKIRGWICENGHSWNAAVQTRFTRKFGCPVCSGKKTLAGFNDLATTHPVLAAEADGWDPKTVTAGSNEKRRWICENGHSWDASPNHRTQGRGCPTCAQTGFDPNQPGFMYFIDHFGLGMFQIGISNFPEVRLGRHKRSGWEVIELRGPMDGHLTQKLETNCLHALEKRGAILGHKARIDKFDGYTEAWTKASLNVTSIKQILDWVYEDETK